MVARASTPRLPLYERIFIRFSKGTLVDGMWIGACGNDAKAVARVVSALTLIQLYDQRRYARITQDLKRIWVTPLIGCTGEFSVAEMMCRIDSKQLEDLPLEYVASVIVHEATHARLSNRKIEYQEDLRFRIERACMMQELAFAKRLPDNSVVIQSIESRLSVACPDTWSNKTFRARFEEKAHQRAREIGIPDWLTSALIRIGKAIRAVRRWAKPGVTFPSA